MGPVENKCGQPFSKPGGGGHQRRRPHHCSFECQVLRGRRISNLAKTLITMFDCSLFRVVRLELGGAEVEEIAGGSEEEEVILILIGTNTCFK